ncbi:MAG TPA: cobalamin-independent methionine synthase II family protein [Chloroflexota bacterium]|nr:cobalamin-independent methionine synthase II family protein [Chloroflexota bacterium]
MKRSTDRILVTHAGSLPRPDDLRAMVAARASGQPYDAEALGARVRSAVAETVRQQAAAGIDVVNDGELSKSNFLFYVRERLGGCADQPPTMASTATAGISGRDARDFPEYFAEDSGRRQIGAQLAQKRVSAVEPLRYVGQAAIQIDIANFKAALAGLAVEEAFLPAVAPGSIEHWLGNAYYPTHEAFLFGIAEAMREEYRAIVDAGFVLQIDDPGLADSWQMHPDMGVPAYRKLAALHVEALNHALRDIPPDRVRFHMCWGSYHGPHKHDIPLRVIVDLILQVRAEAYSIEASNAAHEHEWRVWEDVRLPEGKILIPGVAGHASDFVEHPELVAERLVRYARLVGRENVIAGTDCGLGERVGHPSLVWAKFQAMAEGARLATKQLWG